MYQRVLVPLDGSELAESVLPHVKAIAKCCNVAEVILLQVVELSPALRAADVNVRAFQEASVKAGKEYLSTIEAQLRSEGLNVRSEVLAGAVPAATIADFMQQNGVDFVTITTHGRSGISRWVFGSVAEKLLRCCGIPILVIRPTSES
jgi:nucleotide-binding universal stress UspA family protein